MRYTGNIVKYIFFSFCFNSILNITIFYHRARGRGGMNLGPSGFNTSGNFGGRNSRGTGGPMRGGRNAVGGMKGTEESTTGHSVHMRGLPFEATVSDVYQFFAPINPVEVRLLYEESGRPKGECDVDWATHNDAEAAMLKDKQNMGKL